MRFDQRNNYVIIEDPLPAGLEPIDTSLATTARNLGAQARVMPAGTFNALPLQACTMYKPEVIGRTAGSIGAVKEK